MQRVEALLLENESLKLQLSKCKEALKCLTAEFSGKEPADFQSDERKVNDRDTDELVVIDDPLEDAAPSSERSDEPPQPPRNLRCENITETEQKAAKPPIPPMKPIIPPISSGKPAIKSLNIGQIAHRPVHSPSSHMSDMLLL